MPKSGTGKSYTRYSDNVMQQPLYIPLSLIFFIMPLYGMSHIKYVVDQFTGKGSVKPNSSTSLSRLRTGKTPPLKLRTMVIFPQLANPIIVQMWKSFWIEYPRVL
jgi:hypothetical protein